MNSRYGKRRDLAGFDFASTAPENVCVTDRNADRFQVCIDRGLVRQHQLFLRAVRDAHHVDIAKLSAALAPVGMSHDVESTNLPAGFYLASFGHRPVKQRVEFGNALAGAERFDMFQKGREPDQ